MRILLVEDNEDNRDMLSRRLRRKGHQVHTATDGAQGLSMATGLLPELILMDLDLPQIDGWEATQRIKDAPETAHIPVIALTSHAMGNDGNIYLRRNRRILRGNNIYAFLISHCCTLNLYTHIFLVLLINNHYSCFIYIIYLSFFFLFRDIFIIISCKIICI